VVHNFRFHLQFYRAALEKPSCRDEQDPTVPFGLDDCGLDDPLFVQVTVDAAASVANTLRGRRLEGKAGRARRRADERQKKKKGLDVAPADARHALSHVRAPG
jgi:hypothetical protein